MRIKGLQIFTSSLKKQRHFYATVLNLPVRTVSVSKIEVEIGYSLIQFEYNPEATPYHIAFHISAKKENEALKWLKKRIPILKMGDCEIVYFSDWNAKSLYFYDADHNIMEFISRRHLHKSATEAFSENDICGIAEIGLATQNVKNVYDKVHQEIGLEKYSGDFEKFCPIGDDLGLLITIDNQQKKTWFPTTDKAENSEFSLKFSHQHKNKKLHFDGEDVSFT